MAESSIAHPMGSAADQLVQLVRQYPALVSPCPAEPPTPRVDYRQPDPIAVLRLVAEYFRSDVGVTRTSCGCCFGEAPTMHGEIVGDVVHDIDCLYDLAVRAIAQAEER